MSQQGLSCGILRGTAIVVYFNIQIERSGRTGELRRNRAGSSGLALDLMLVCNILIPIPLIAQSCIASRVIAAGVLEYTHDRLHGLTGRNGNRRCDRLDIHRGKAWPHDNAHRVGFDPVTVLRLDRCLDRGRAGCGCRRDLVERIACVTQLDDALRLCAPFNGRAGGIHVFRLGGQSRIRLIAVILHLKQTGSRRERNTGFDRAKPEDRVVGIERPVCAKALDDTIYSTRRIGGSITD